MKMILKVDGKVIDNVVGFECCTCDDKVTVVSNCDGFIASVECLASTLEINVSNVDDKNSRSIPCVRRHSEKYCEPMTGRFPVMSIDNLGHMVLVDEDFQVINVRVAESDVETARSIAGRGFGSVYLEINNIGLGMVYDVEIEK